MDTKYRIIQDIRSALDGISEAQNVRFEDLIRMIGGSKNNTELSEKELSENSDKSKIEIPTDRMVAFYFASDQLQRSYSDIRSFLENLGYAMHAYYACQLTMILQVKISPKNSFQAIKSICFLC